MERGCLYVGKRSGGNFHNGQMDAGTSTAMKCRNGRRTSLLEGTTEAAGAVAREKRVSCKLTRETQTISKLFPRHGKGSFKKSGKS